jgi:hypothetical protein
MASRLPETRVTVLLGGLNAFGVMGLSIGPVILSFTIVALEMLGGEHHEPLHGLIVVRCADSAQRRYARGWFMMRSAAIVLTFSSLIAGLSFPGLSQTSGELQDYFQNSVGLSPEQIADIRGGKSVGKVMKSRTPDEIFVWGAVYVKASPESYVESQVTSVVWRNFPNSWRSANSAILPR